MKYLKIAGYFLFVIYLAGCAGNVVIDNKEKVESAGKLLCGGATVDITPGFPVALSGYPSRPLSTGVLDPLYARIIVLKLDEKELVFISTDLIGFGIADTLLQELSGQLFIQTERIFLSANHNHSGPALAWDDAKDENPNVRYSRELLNRLAGGVKDARSRMTPVFVAGWKGISRVGINRRVFEPEASRWSGVTSSVRITRSPQGPVDPEVLAVAFLQEKDLNYQSLMFSYSCHNRSFRANRAVISADIFGVAATMAESRFGAPVASFAGASGDIDPWFTEGYKLSDDEEYKKMETTGRMLGYELIGTVEALKQQYIDRSGNHVLEASRIELSCQARNASVVTVNTRLSFALVDSVFVVASDCELTMDIGLAIKAASPFKNTLIMTCTNGGKGYMPGSELYANGGYEVQSTQFAPGSSEKVIQAVKEKAQEYYRIYTEKIRS